MPKQRMAGYTPLRGEPWRPASSGPGTPPTATPAVLGAPVGAPAVTESTATVTGVPYERRQRMAGYTPFRGAAPAAPASAAPADAAPAVPAGAPAGPAAAQAAVAEIPAAAPVAARTAPATVGRRMKGYTPLKSAAYVPGARAAAPEPETLTPVLQQAAATPAPEPAAARSAAPSEAAVRAAPTAPDTRSAPPASSVPSPAAARDGEATVKPAAGADVGTPRWRRLLWPVLGVVLTGLVLVLAARWLRTLDPVADFIAQYPGEPALPEGTPVGLPPWLGWQHFLNMFLMVLIIRTGLQIRAEQRPPANFTPTENGLFLARGNTPKKYSLTIWTHMALDALWLVNGLIFVILLLATGQWARIVPTDPAVLQHALSTGIQYLSLDWPQENGWSHYNALQMISYGLVVFVLAPISALTGWRMSSWFPTTSGLARAFPMELARRVHFPAMALFAAFIVVHVLLVLLTGALRNLNHMYTSRDVVDWWGLVVFLVSLAVVAAGWFFLKPAFTAPAAEKFGTVGR